MPGPVAAEIKPVADEWLESGCPSSPQRRAAQSLPGALGPAERSTSPIPSSPTMPAARATSFRRSGRTRRTPTIGWGKTTQFGYGLGLGHGRCLACPDKLCINVWGDVAIGFHWHGLRDGGAERIPIMSVLLNNFSMAIELHAKVSTEKYRSTDIPATMPVMARAFGGYCGERVTKPEDIVPAIRRYRADQEGACWCCSSSSPPRKPMISEEAGPYRRRAANLRGKYPIASV